MKVRMERSESGLYWREITELDSDDYPFVRAVNSDGKWIGSEEFAGWLCDEMGVVPGTRDETGLRSDVGFSEKQRKWYGWNPATSRKIIDGDNVVNTVMSFGIGSEVKKGDLCYVADTPEQMAEDFVHYPFVDVDDEEYQKLEFKYAKELYDFDGISRGMVYATMMERRDRCLHVADEGIYTIIETTFLADGNTRKKAVKRELDAGRDYREMWAEFGIRLAFMPVGKGERVASNLDDARRMAYDYATAVAHI